MKKITTLSKYHALLKSATFRLNVELYGIEQAIKLNPVTLIMRPEDSINWEQVERWSKVRERIRWAIENFVINWATEIEENKSKAQEEYGHLTIAEMQEIFDRQEKGLYNEDDFIQGL